MNLLQLQYFRQLAEDENFTRSARNLFVSQPALSKMIRQMENELGVSLFDRKGKKIFLNEYGRTYLEYVNDSLSALEAGKEMLKKMKAQHTERITFYCSAKIEKIRAAVLDFWRQYPEFPISYVPGNADSARDKILAGEIDFALVNKKVRDSQLKCELMSSNRLYVFLGSGHSMRDQKVISVRDLADTEFIYNRYSVDIDEIKKIFKEYRMVPKIALESSDIETIISVMSEKPYGFLVRSNVVHDVISRERHMPGSFHMFKESLVMPDYILTRGDREFTPLQQMFMTFLRDEIQKYDVMTNQFTEDYFS